MIYLFLSRSIAWPLNIFGMNSNDKNPSILDAGSQRIKDPDVSSPLISNRDLILNADLSDNMDHTKSLIDKNKVATFPPRNVLSVLGKHYLTREDLDALIQARFQQETPRDRVVRFLWK
ncbi:unnamed protein product, partial [Rotaria magnacalcarata]